jgi:hypothetical protein
LEKNGNTLMLYCAATTFNEPFLPQTKVMKPDQVWMADRERLAFSVPQFQSVSGVGVPALEHPSATSVLPAQALANSTPIMNESARVVFGLADMLAPKKSS